MTEITKASLEFQEAQNMLEDTKLDLEEARQAYLAHTVLLSQFLLNPHGDPVIKSHLP